MTVLARKFASIPQRSAVDTWARISALLSKDKSSARDELESISGIACALIASEAMTSAIVTSGVGPRVRVYCIYGEDAITGDDCNESSLPHDPTDGDWKISLPCRAEDIQWVQAALGKRTKRVTARDMEELIGEEEEKSRSGRTTSNAAFDVDLDRFLKL